MIKISRFLQATVFETQKEYDNYMKEHPNADKTKHSVKKQIGHDLDHPAYNDRVSVPKYNGKPNIFNSGLTHKQRGKMLIKNKPDWSAKDHADLAKIHGDLADQSKKAYDSKLDEAAQHTWGRNFSPMDYKVSGIGSSEFSDKHKGELRDLIHQGQKHSDVQHAHEEAHKILSKK